MSYSGRVESVSDVSGAVQTNSAPVSGVTNVGAPGPSGATFTPSVSEDGDLSWTNDRELDNPDTVNIKGRPGKAGNDGVSPTVEVSKSGKVTTVSVTDKNGTKTSTINDGTDGTSVTVKSVSESTAAGGSNVVTFSDGKTVTIKNGKDGTPGYTPQKGVDYTDGTSVTVKSVSESTADGGSNVVTFSDGKIVTIKNGKQGSPGKTPVKGTDYFTAADQEEIVQQTLIALGKPVVGEVDANKNIKLVGTLASGVYSVKCELEDGSLVDVGQITIGGISYTNLVPTAEAHDSTSPYNGVGYKNGYYVSSSAPYEGTDSATVLTGYMPYSIPETGLPGTIYVSGAEVQTISHCRVYFFNDIKTMSGSGVQGSQWSTYFTIETLPNGVTKLTPIASGDKSKLLADTKANTNVKYFRMSLVGTGENLIITVNEPIE